MISISLDDPKFFQKVNAMNPKKFNQEKMAKNIEEEKARNAIDSKTSKKQCQCQCHTHQVTNDESGKEISSFNIGLPCGYKPRCRCKEIETVPTSPTDTEQERHLKQATMRLASLIRESNALVANGVVTSVAKTYGVSVRELRKSLRENEGINDKDIIVTSPTENAEELREKQWRCQHNHVAVRTTDGGFFHDCYDCGARLLPWSMVNNKKLERLVASSNQRAVQAFGEKVLKELPDDSVVTTKYGYASDEKKYGFRIGIAEAVSVITSLMGGSK